MINKRSSFAHHSVQDAGRVSIRKAISLEKHLTNWSFDFSLYPERSMPWMEVVEVFARAATTGYNPSTNEIMSFVRASKVAHRMESSLRVEQGVDMEEFENNPLVLRIKFYYRNDRREFLEWKMTFGDMGRIYQAGMTGTGVIGKEVMT